jgi:cell division septal protein FtsQ
MKNRKVKRKSPEYFLRVTAEQSRQDTKRLHTKAWMIAGGLVLMAVVGLGVNYATEQILRTLLFTNSDFHLKTIEVQVQGNLTRSDVLRITGVREGDNLMALDLAELRDRIKAQPQVARVKVMRELPATLRIEIEERQPVARVVPHNKEGNYLVQVVYYIDAQGYFMRPKPGEKLKQLPVITGILSDFVVEGERTQRPEMLSALNLLRMLEYSTVKGELNTSRIVLQREDTLCMATATNGVVYFRTEYLDQQLDRLGWIMNSARQDGRVVKRVDLTPEKNVPVLFY